MVQARAAIPAFLSGNSMKRQVTIQPDQEQRLIYAAQHGDEQAFSALYNAYVDPIYRYIMLRVNHTEVAQDLTADVFLRVVEGLPSYEYRGLPFLAWVYRIAQARVMDSFRQASHPVETPVHEALNLSIEDDIDGALMAAEQRAKVQAALGALTPEQQQVICLRFTEGYDLQTTAALLGKTVGAVKLLQHRALRALSKALQDHDTTSD